MVRGLIICLWLILGGILYSLSAQERQESDSSYLGQKGKSPVSLREKNDSVSRARVEKPVVLIDSLVLKKNVEFKPDPTKAIIYSAIFPGLGQFYNRKYWKLPLLYGGFVGLAYAISWNGARYNEYALAYQDLMLETGTSYLNFLPPGMTVESYGKDQFAARLRRQKDFFRRNRDLSIISTVGLYALAMIDAYVDAHLYDFDISPDLSMRVEPVYWGPTPYSKSTIGLQCSINF